jgi:hypothetical protein
MAMRHLMTLTLLAVGGCAPTPRLRPFTTDGCSLFPDGNPKNKTLWLACCEEHDRKYWMGGTKAERLDADLELRACVAATGQPRTAEWMLRGTRLGGTPYLPAGFRWGYGWPYPRGYKPLSDAEKKLVEESPHR